MDGGRGGEHGAASWDFAVDITPRSCDSDSGLDVMTTTTMDIACLPSL